MADALDQFLNKYSTGDTQALRTKLMDRLGIPENASPRFLGKGSYGSAFDIGSSVAKLTLDATEANAMSIVAANPNPYLVKVYDVFKFSPRYVKTPVFVIKQEKLSKPDAAWAKFANDVRYEVIGGTGRTPISTRMVSAFVKEFYQDEDLQFELPHFTDDRIKWLVGVTKYLERVGIKFYDFQAGNIMKGKAGHVLIDLGASRSPVAKIALVASAITNTTTSIRG